MYTKYQILLVLDYRSLQNAFSDDVIDELIEKIDKQLTSYNNGFYQEVTIFDEIHFIRIVDVVYVLEAIMDIRNYIVNHGIGDISMNIEIRPMDETE